MFAALKFCFLEFGIPEEVISDNGKQFTGREYQDFAGKYGFKLTTSSPYYPKGHRFTERQRQTIKIYWVSVMVMAQTTTWPYYSWKPPQWTAGYLHHASCYRADNLKPHYLLSSGLQPTMNLSEHPFNPCRVIQTMMLMLRSCQGSYPNNMCGGAEYLDQSMVQGCCKVQGWDLQVICCVYTRCW